MLVTIRAVPCATDRTARGYGENNTISWRPIGSRMARLTVAHSGLGWRADTRAITVACPAVPDEAPPIHDTESVLWRTLQARSSQTSRADFRVHVFCYATREQPLDGCAGFLGMAS